MTRAAQNFLLLLLGGAVLWITLGTGEFTNYVKPGLELPLVGSAVLLILLGLAGLRRDWTDRADLPTPAARVPAARPEASLPTAEQVTAAAATAESTAVVIDEIRHDDERRRTDLSPGDGLRQTALRDSGAGHVASRSGQPAHEHAALADRHAALGDGGLGDGALGDAALGDGDGQTGFRSSGKGSAASLGGHVGHGDGDAGHEEGHGHSHKHGGPRVAWLLCLPVLGIFAIAPPELGAFTADRNSSVTRNVAPPPSVDEALPAGDGPLKMSVAEFVGRSFEAQIGGDPTLTGREVRLLGFAAPRKQGHWYLTRLQMSCCAADTIALQVIVLGAPAPGKGSWVEVTGVWKAPEAKESGTGVHYLTATGVTPATKPGLPYE